METLKKYNGPGKIITTLEAIEQLTENANTNKKKSNSLFTTITSLDAYLINFEQNREFPIVGGELIIISGDEGEGKTLLARSFTRAFTREKQKKTILWFSYEETTEQFLKKFGNDAMPIFLLPNELVESTTTWIETRIKEAIAKYDRIDAVFIDHLHYLVDLDKQNIATEIGRVCRTLKLLAIKYDIAMFLIVHTNRSGDTADGEPTNKSLRDSGLIGKEADTILFIWRKPEDNRAKIKLTKARGSGAKNKYVNLKKEGPYLYEDFENE